MWEATGTAVICFSAFGFLSDAKARAVVVIRLLLLVIASASAFLAAEGFFAHPGWEEKFAATSVPSGRGAIVYGIALLGPKVIGSAFAVMALLSAVMARVHWRIVFNTEATRIDTAIVFAGWVVFHPVAAAKHLHGRLLAYVAQPGVGLVVAALLISAGLFAVAFSLR